MTTNLRLTTPLLLALLACKPGSGDDGDGSTTGLETGTVGDETFGMGVTSNATATDSDPTKPPTTDSTTSTSTTTVGTITTTGPDTDPTVSEVTSVSSVSSNSDFTTDITASETSSTSEFSSSDSFSSGPACPDPPDQPQDGECTDASGCGCASGRCFLVPILGGWCGECLVDGDCPEGGCTVPNPILGTGALCNTGKMGAGCMTDAVCNDPDFQHCTAILDVPGIITVSTCGQCADNGDCPPQQPNCTPDYDILNFTGVSFCAPDASVPNNEGCDWHDDGMGGTLGDEACQSGFCGDANVMGLLHVGICGECNSNADCQQGQTCTDPVVDLMLGQLIGSVCQ